MSQAPRLGGHGRSRLSPDYRRRLRKLAAAHNWNGAERILGMGSATLMRAVEPEVFLLTATVERLTAALDRVGT